jgi:hypothetical protein
MLVKFHVPEGNILIIYGLDSFLISVFYTYGSWKGLRYVHVHKNPRIGSFVGRGIVELLQQLLHISPSYFLSQQGFFQDKIPIRASRV